MSEKEREGGGAEMKGGSRERKRHYLLFYELPQNAVVPNIFNLLLLAKLFPFILISNGHSSRVLCSDKKS